MIKGIHTLGLRPFYKPIFQFPFLSKQVAQVLLSPQMKGFMLNERHSG